MDFNLNTGEFVIVSGEDIWLDNLSETFKSREEAEEFASSFFKVGTWKVVELKFFFLP